MGPIRKLSFWMGMLIAFTLGSLTWRLMNGVGEDTKDHLTEIRVEEVDLQKDVKNSEAQGSSDTDQEMTWEEMMEKRHSERSRRLWNYCKTSKLDQLEYKQIGGNVIVSVEHKMMWCIVPKVGSNQWKEVMGKLERLERIPKDIFTRAGFKYYNNFPPERQQQMLKTYHKFMFVRHPFERLLSAYRDKFGKKSPAFLKIFGRAIIRKYRPNATEYALETGDGVTFPEFAKYVANLNWKYFDFHWRPFYRQCHACVIPYDYVGHFETYKEDADYILKRAGVDHLVTFPPLHGSDTTSELLEHYADVPKETIMQLSRTYQDDLEMFAYPFPGPLKPLVEQYDEGNSPAVN